MLQLPQPTFMGCIRGGGYDYDYENSNTINKTASAIAKISDNNTNDDAANNSDKYISSTATNSNGCRLKYWESEPPNIRGRFRKNPQKA